MAIAGPVSRQMLEHYSHIRMVAKRVALDSIATPLPDPASVKALVFDKGVHQIGNQKSNKQKVTTGKSLN
jgi:hypothetical protein